MPDRPKMPDAPTKGERASIGRQIAAYAAAEAAGLVAAGRRREAEETLVHAYHDGAPALALVDAYHTHLSTLEGARP